MNYGSLFDSIGQVLSDLFGWVQFVFSQGFWIGNTYVSFFTAFSFGFIAVMFGIWIAKLVNPFS